MSISSSVRSKRFWGVILSLIFLWLALRRVEWNRLPAVMKCIDLRFVAAMVVSLITEGLLRAWRWQVILSGRNLPFRQSYTGLMLGYFFNNIFPARAGEFMRAGYIGRKGLIPSSEAFGSVVIERFVDGITILTMIMISLHRFEVSPGIRQASFSALFFYVLVLLFILLFQFKRHLIFPILDFFISYLPENIKVKFEKALDAFIRGLDAIRHPARFLAVMILSFFAWSVSTFTYYLSLRVFGLDYLNWDAALLLISVLSLGAMIPSSPGMIGIYQWCCMLVLTDIFHVPAEVSASHGLFTQFVGYMTVLIISFGLLSIENISLTKLQEELSDKSVTLSARSESSPNLS